VIEECHSQEHQVLLCLVCLSVRRLHVVCSSLSLLYFVHYSVVLCRKVCFKLKYLLFRCLFRVVIRVSLAVPHSD
jgi:hypothetical protein